MIKFSDQFTSDIIFALGWTIVHSIWQFSIITLCLISALKFINHTIIRYNLALLALAACALTSIVTFYQYYSSITSISITSTGAVLQLSSGMIESAIHFVNTHLSLLVCIWLAGFSLHLFRTSADFLHCRKLVVNECYTLDEMRRGRFNHLQHILGIKQYIAYKVSHLVNSPCVVGVFRPIILIPSSMLMQMPTAQIEAVILHELAHIRRNDYLVNFIQCIAKSLFFFNPFFSYISKIVNQERENSCDDIAVQACGSALVFSKSISMLAELNSNNTLTLAANSSKHLILTRIKRLFGDTPAKRNSFQFLCSAFIGLLGGIIATNLQALPMQESINTSEMVIPHQKLTTENNNISKIEGARKPNEMKITQPNHAPEPVQYPNPVAVINPIISLEPVVKPMAINPIVSLEPVVKPVTVNSIIPLESVVKPMAINPIIPLEPVVKPMAVSPATPPEPAVKPIAVKPIVPPEPAAIKIFHSTKPVTFQEKMLIQKSAVNYAMLELKQAQAKATSVNNQTVNSNGLLITDNTLNRSGIIKQASNTTTSNSQVSEEFQHASPLGRYLATKPKLTPKSQDYSNWEKSRFSLFFLDETVDFSKYDEVILFPMTFDRMKISQGARNRDSDKWLDSTFKDMDTLCGYFDKYAKQAFNHSRQYSITKQGGKNVLAVEFRMMDLTPFSAPGTTAFNSGIVGNLIIQAVLVESQSGKLVAVIEHQIRVQDFQLNFFHAHRSIEVGYGLQSLGGVKGNAGKSWRKSFKLLAKNLQRDMTKLKKIHETRTG